MSSPTEPAPPRSALTPVHDGYFADPFLLRQDGGYVAYGTSEASSDRNGPSFEALTSPDLHAWRPAGTVFTLDPATGTDIWAPEVVHVDDAWWMYYSAGFGIAGHHLRVARAESPLGPFIDQEVNLTPDETFAIDASPFKDTDGTRYLYFARDVLNGDRPGTHLAVRRMTSMTELDSETVPVLAPNADWQQYAANREMYGRRLNWHTLEGPTVVRRDRTYVLLYSGGSWEGPNYGVSYATATRPLGPWTHQGTDTPLVLSQALTGQVGPGHNSLLEQADGTWVTAYHAWNHQGSRRQLYVEPLHWAGAQPFLKCN